MGHCVAVRVAHSAAIPAAVAALAVAGGVAEHGECGIMGPVDLATLTMIILEMNRSHISNIKFVTLSQSMQSAGGFK